MKWDPNTRVRYGCLTALGLFAAYIAFAEWIHPEAAGDGAGGGAAIMVMGFFALAVLYGSSGILWLIAKLKREPRGFPVEPKDPDREK